MFKIRNNDTAVDGISAFKMQALTTALRSHVNIDLVANGSTETHGHSFIFGDVASTSTGVFVACADEVEWVEEVVRVQLIVELVSLDEAEGRESKVKAVKERHGCSDCLW